MYEWQIENESEEKKRIVKSQLSNKAEEVSIINKKHNIEFEADSRLRSDSTATARQKKKHDLFYFILFFRFSPIILPLF